jgi:hypothetical protein
VGEDLDGGRVGGLRTFKVFHSEVRNSVGWDKFSVHSALEVFVLSREALQ